VAHIDRAIECKVEAYRRCPPGMPREIAGTRYAELEILLAPTFLSDLQRSGIAGVLSAMLRHG
jgi:hypothetical protein